MRWMCLLLVMLASCSFAGTVTTTGGESELTLRPRGTGAGDTGWLRFRELVANGSNVVGFKAPDTIAADKIWVLPNADGSSGQLLKTDGSLNLGWVSPTSLTINFDQIATGTNTAATMTVSTGASLVPGGSGIITATRFTGSGSSTNAVDLGTAEIAGTLAIANGGTGQTSANAAFNALAPSQGGNSGKYLTTNATDTSWGSPVTSVALSLPGSLFSVSGSPVTTTGTLTGSFVNVAARTFFAGPEQGNPDAAPAFRTLVTTDLPTGTVLTGSTNTFTNAQTFDSFVAFTEISKSISADQNNYDFGGASFVRIESDATRTITGLLNGTHQSGRLLIIVNFGSNAIVLAHQSASSTAANRIISPTGANVTLQANYGAILIYDITDDRWRIIHVYIVAGGSGTITGSGTNERVARFTPDGTTIGNSSIRDDGTDTAIGTAIDGSFKLKVAGKIYATDNFFTDAVFQSAIATGTAPLVVASTTKVVNLNADTLDDQTGTYYTNADNLASGTVPAARLVNGSNQFLAGTSASAATNWFGGKGVSDGTPTDWTLNGTGARGGTDSNTAGADLQLAGGKGTGTGAQGLVALLNPILGSDGTTAQSLSATQSVLGGMIFSAITAVTHANSLTEQSMIGTVVGSKNYDAWRNGRVMRITARGVLSTDTSASSNTAVIVTIKLGSTTLTACASTQLGASLSNAPWELVVDCTVRDTTAGSVNVDAQGMLRFINSSGAFAAVNMARTDSAPTITSAQAVDFIWDWQTADSENSVTCHQCYCEILN